MTSKAAKSARTLTLTQMFQGMQAIKANASELIFDAEHLGKEGRHARSYALAYCAREELSKLMILLETSWKVALGAPLDWRSFWVEMNDHISKAAQFILADSVISDDVLQFRDRLWRNSFKTIEAQAFSAFDRRNEGLYSDIDEEGVFRRPTELISEDAARSMISLAKKDLEVANSVFND